MKHIVMFSGGVCSWATGKWVVKKYGVDNTLLLFTDPNMEDEDLYRFIREAQASVGAEMITISDAKRRTPWDVFFDVKMLGNSRVDPCSRILKRELSRKWLEKNFKYYNASVYIGIDWTEILRYTGDEENNKKRIGARKRWLPWKCYAPLATDWKINKDQQFDLLAKEGIARPRLYDLGFPHNNCGGFCVKSGMQTFKLLLDKMPDRYAYHEEMEEKFRKFIGKDVAILRDRRYNKTRPLTLREFRERWAKDKKKCEQFKFDFGGCACFTPDEEDG